MTKELKAEPREQLTKGANNRLRKAGKIPAVVYGHKEPITIAVDEREFNNNFKKISANEIINLSLGTKEHKVLIKDYQRNYLKGSIVHLDFYEIEKGHKLRTHVPIKIVGQAAGVREGGILEHSLHALDIECLAELLPATIDIDVSTLTMGHAIHVRDLKVSAGIKILNNGEQVVASIAHIRVEAAPVAAVEAAPVAAAAAPAAAAKKE
jgi:large subunit ribosomal protein L25